jgi:hypothetical protein
MYSIYRDQILETEKDVSVLIIAQKVTVPGFGDSWFNPKAIDNIFEAKQKKNGVCTVCA